MSFELKCADIYISVTSLDQHFSIIFVNNIYIKNIKTF